MYQVDCKLQEYGNRKHVVASLEKKVAALGADSEFVKALDIPRELEKTVFLTAALRCLRTDMSAVTIESFLEKKAACAAKLKEVAVHMSRLTGIHQAMVEREAAQEVREPQKGARLSLA